MNYNLKSIERKHTHSGTSLGIEIIVGNVRIIGVKVQYARYCLIIQQHSVNQLFKRLVLNLMSLIVCIIHKLPYFCYQRLYDAY